MMSMGIIQAAHFQTALQFQGPKKCLSRPNKRGLAASAAAYFIAAP
jgi:hypothetical protein